MCPSEAQAQKLTIVDLEDAWAPRLFAPGPDGTAPEYRETYLELAAERDKNGKPIDDREALGELYGVLPSLAIVRERLADEARHACHAAIDPSPIGTLARPFAQDHGPLVKMNSNARVALEKQLEKERVKRGLADFPSLAKIPDLAPKYARWKKLADQHAGIVTAQRKLVCEGFLPEKDADGTMTWRTSDAVELFQRRNFLMPNERLDPETREAMMQDSRELDYRLALRILRERVVDATGLLEDGTAGDGPQPILDRMLDPAAMRAARGRETPLPNAAPDLVSPTTEAAAKHLAWTGPAEVAAFLARHKTGVRVALALPPPPAYHAAHMDLSAELDRGDVWYDDTPIKRKITRRPTVTVFVNDNGTKRPLVRWPTTIGGWSDVRTAGGYVHQRWKESDVGPRVWRDLFAAPTWMPPPTTPDKDLVKNLYNGKWELKRSIMGPGPHAAYGMVLLVHDNVVKQKDGTEKYWDNGIGTHGSSSVTSIVNGTSHGCHRLYNGLAVRLADFLLRHREHEVKGQMPVKYRRVVRHKGTFVAKLDTRGFHYQLTPPVPITVLKGNIRSQRKVPPKNAAPASE
ncbi:MAG: murein L,D-transpeptidase [Deltaproteobacteria bacterium]|nr:murein L,D-transpeptidase [Deltaproteobacteria bacterium]MDQ3300298.1 L,D-transpeptidase family protein [Myxococcota bacterium]